jgi:Inner membrane protein YgaP-like, transmembrane domain
MLSNMSKVDRLIRTGSSFVIFFGSIYFKGFLAILGIFILLTAVISWCPIYALFHISTTNKQVEIPANTSGEHKPPQGPKRLLK